MSRLAWERKRFERFNELIRDLDVKPRNSFMGRPTQATTDAIRAAIDQLNVELPMPKRLEVPPDALKGHGRGRPRKKCGHDPLERRAREVKVNGKKYITTYCSECSRESARAASKKRKAA